MLEATVFLKAPGQYRKTVTVTFNVTPSTYSGSFVNHCPSSGTCQGTDKPEITYSIPASFGTGGTLRVKASPTATEGRDLDRVNGLIGVGTPVEIALEAAGLSVKAPDDKGREPYKFELTVESRNAVRDSPAASQICSKTATTGGVKANESPVLGVSNTCTWSQLGLYFVGSNLPVSYMTQRLSLKGTDKDGKTFMSSSGVYVDFRLAEVATLYRFIPRVSWVNFMYSVTPLPGTPLKAGAGQRMDFGGEWFLGTRNTADLAVRLFDQDGVLQASSDFQRVTADFDYHSYRFVFPSFTPSATTTRVDVKAVLIDPISASVLSQSLVLSYPVLGPLTGLVKRSATDQAGKRHVTWLPDATVELVDGATDAVLATTRAKDHPTDTDVKSYFSFDNVTVDSGKPYRIRIKLQDLRTPGQPQLAVYATPADASPAELRFPAFTPGSLSGPLDLAVAADKIESSDPGTAVAAAEFYWHLWRMVYKLYPTYFTRPFSRPLPVSVSLNADNTRYCPDKTRYAGCERSSGIRLRPVDGAVGAHPATMWHEFGHHVIRELYAADEIPRPAFDPADTLKLDGRHFGYPNSHTCDSIDEGFATFWALLGLLELEGEKGGDYYFNYAQGGYTPSPIEPNYPVTSGRDAVALSQEEVAVSGILWDLVDDTPSEDETSSIDGGSLPDDIALSCKGVKCFPRDTVSVPPKDLLALWAQSAPRPSTLLQLHDMLQRGLPPALTTPAGNPRGSGLSQLDEVFLMHRAYADANGNLRYDGAGETIGKASNGKPFFGGVSENFDVAQPRRVDVPARPWRENVPQLYGSWIETTLKTTDGGPTANAPVDIQLVYGAGFEAFNQTSRGSLVNGKVYFQMPPSHYPVEARLTIPGSDEPPAIVRNADYWASVGSPSPPDTFQAHTFVVPDVAPSIDALSPAAAAPGDPVTLTGTGFKQSLAANVVTFGSERAIVTSASGSQLGVLVPANLPAGTVPVAVSVGDKVSAPVSFAVAAPTLDLGGTTSVDFGDVAVGATADRTVALHNGGTAPLRLLALAATGGRFAVVSPAPPVSVPAGSSQTVSVRFSPSAPGAQGGTLLLSTSDPTRRSASVALRGTGRAASGPDLNLSGETADFGQVAVGQAQTLTVTLSNPGASVLTVSAAAGSPASFALASPAVPFTVPASGQQALTLRFTPASAGAQSGTITLTSNAASRPQIAVLVRGEGTSAPLSPETLLTDDGTAEFAYIRDGFTIVNRLTPSRYPVRLQTIRLYLSPITEYPNPSGAPITLIAYLDPAGSAASTQTPQILLSQPATFPAISGGGFVDFPIANGPTVVSGDLYVGYRAPSPAGGVGFPYDQNGPQQQRSWFSTDGGVTFAGPLVFVDPQQGQSTKVNMMIRAVVAPVAGSSCPYALGPTAPTLGPDAATGSLTLTAPAGCAWSATSDSPWLAVTSATGTGSGSIAYSVLANPAGSPRVARVTVGSLSASITQSAGEPTRDVFVPIVLSAPGQSGSFFGSELTLTNRGTTSAVAELTYSPALGTGSGVGLDVLPPGGQLTVPDAVSYLRSVGVPIPGSGSRGGTLRVRFRSLSSPGAASAAARTSTPVPEGRAGLAYGGVPPGGGLTGPAYLCGLRQTAADRSNVAVMSMGKDGDGDIQLRLTVFSGDPANRVSKVLPDLSLAPGGFAQISGILASNGLSLSNGYVRVERVGGSAPFTAYGVVNDAVNSDGSFVPPLPEASLVGRTGLTLPVVVEASVFSSDLVVTNFSSTGKTIRFAFVADGVQTADKTARFSLSVGAGEQVLIPALVAYLRQQGTSGIGPEGGSYVGALFATVDGGDVGGLFVGSRTSSPGGGGRYGLFYAAVPYGLAATTSAWLYGLRQDTLDRANLALVNTGETDGTTDVLRIDIYDGDTGQLVRALDGTTVAARRWTQITTLLSVYAPGTRNAYVHVTRTAGNNPFVVYAVVNDGGKPGERSGDGAFIPMEVAE